ncbi:hypothetical protein AC477_05095 [miscellaneous Crenarchaeota group-1 archaeon SG8-32-1]|uniref:Uncharacterized protein n=1 Tax=miscellaneous Crenarchaeota group-1 archaeon SG8-32-1 TaxID=1685124 RepID=A0A0M0BNZ1_9ARCH|nr:MAG: hypothetical protein AC477_05095 [miscellaneous Crenarchaeota group-1 archaeon SG8-32-1]
MTDIIRTIRTNREWDTILKDEANTRGISINCLLNQIIERYVFSYRFIDVFPCLVLPCEMVKGLLEGLTDEQLIKEGQSAGSFIPKHSLFLKGLIPDLDTIMLCMENNVSQHSNWYQFQCHKINGRITMLLRHQLGRKWSIYLQAYYSALFKKLINLQIKSEIGENSLAIKLPKSIKLNTNNNGLEQVQVQNHSSPKNNSLKK